MPNHQVRFKPALTLLLLLLPVVTTLVGGCTPPPNAIFPFDGNNRRLVRRVFSPEEVLGPLKADALVEFYRPSALLYAELEEDGAAPVVVTYTSETIGDRVIDDARLMIYVGGSGDTAEGFYHTARLIAGSPLVWVLDRRPLLILALNWSDSLDPVAEHMNLTAQQRGALILQQMAHVHTLRHRNQPSGQISVLAFSAGTRVVQLAFGCVIEPDKVTAIDGHTYPDEMNELANIIFVGSSLPRDDPLPFTGIRGRFINFVNPRDTHFGDRATYVAPPGVSPSLARLVTSRLGSGGSGTGASANGFDGIATLVSAEQFLAADNSDLGREAFRMVNVRVPEQLTAFGFFGLRIDKDDLDDFINSAPNHYITVGRGPGGAVSGQLFEQYRAVAEEYIQFIVAPAMATGRVPQMVLYSKPTPLSGVEAITHPLTLPLKVVEPVFGKTRTDGDSSAIPVNLPPGPRPPVEVHAYEP